MPERPDGAGRRRALGGVALSLTAAATFGVLAPASKGALAHVGPLRGAALAYLAAGAVALAALIFGRLPGRGRRGRPASKRDAPRLAGMTLLGGILGPAMFFIGIDRLAAHHAAVLQHLEFGLTVLAAVLILGERPGKPGIGGLVLVGAGVALLSLTDVDRAGVAGSSWLGALFVTGACIAWAGDNTLARGASDLDPLVVVSVKGLGAGIVLNVASAGSPWPSDVRGWGLVALAGGVGVGLSLVLELLALRRIGVSLNAGLFATGPAFGFVWSVAFLGEHGSVSSWVALALCVAGAVALSTDRHEHEHVHEAILHTHRHHHLDGHHTHSHGPGFDPATEHSHEHEHEPLRHAHPHVHDEHHRHRH
jgi:drug/metabolite transporter (DMT)-like permease